MCNALLTHCKAKHLGYSSSGVSHLLACFVLPLWVSGKQHPEITVQTATKEKYGCAGAVLCRAMEMRQGMEHLSHEKG